MGKTFEERAGEELDALYRGALFLEGGHPDRAASLLTESVVRSFRQRGEPAESGDLSRALEARLVGVFLEDAGRRYQGLPAPVRSTRPDPYDREVIGALEGAGLFSAAGSIPPWPRAALWLVLLRRWSYDDAARMLGVDRDLLIDMLAHRDTLMAEVVGGARRRTGTDRPEE